MTALLEVDSIAVRYGAIEAVRDVSLRVEQGEVVAIIGSNGAGKTTVMRTVSGLLRPVRGSITFDGTRIDGLPAHRVTALGVGSVPEGRRVFPTLSVRENLQMGAYLDPSSVPAGLERVFELFPVLAERAKQAGGTLSGGEQQMLAIGRALMSNPRILLLDEPSMGLAPLFVAKIYDIVRHINASGTTVLLVEQNAAAALALAQRAYVLETGTVTLEDTPAALLADDRIRAAYLGS